MNPDEVPAAMTVTVKTATPESRLALLASAIIQNHANFLHCLPDGALVCSWFGGTLEGRLDISIFASVFLPGSEQWGVPQRLSDVVDHLELRLVLFTALDGKLWLFHTF